MPVEGDNLEKPGCFGQEDVVMPRDADGFIQPQDSCSECGFLKDCLRAAMGKMADVERERDIGWRSPHTGRSSTQADGSPVEGVLGFLKRWSERKLAGNADKD